MSVMNDNTMSSDDTADAMNRRVRIEHLVGRLYPLGARPLAEILIALDLKDERLCITDMFADYARLTRATVCAAGGDKFPFRGLRDVPK